MSRPLRINLKNAIYHVMGRGKQTIFHDEEYYQVYLTYLEEAHQRFHLDILAYCLMGNHYHLLVRTPEANLSRSMRHINGVYTQRYNRLKGTDGALFHGRYKALLIGGDNYLLQVSRYIHRNPIELRKPLVEQLEDYPWSSYSCYLNQEKPPGWLDRERVLSVLNSTRRFHVYRQYTEAGVDETTKAFYARKALPGVWGEKGFVEKVKKQLNVKGKKVSLKTAIERPSMRQVITDVARYYDCDESAINRTVRGKGRKNIPRWVAMYLSQTDCGETLPRIAKAFNVGHYSTVSQTIGRLKKELLEDKKLAKVIKLLSQDLTH